MYIVYIGCQQENEPTWISAEILVAGRWEPFFSFPFVPHEMQNEMLNDGKQNWSGKVSLESKEENDKVGSAEWNRG